MRPGSSSRGKRRGGLLAAAAVACALLAPAGAAGKGAYRESAHGRVDSGVLRVPGLKRGECTHCHGAARDASERGPGKRRGHAGLFAGNDNALCQSCHGSPAGTYLGELRYDSSAHGRSPLVVWPGPVPPGRPSTDAGKCVNCHDPHGHRDAAGVIPSLLRVRGAALCLGCHGGNPGADVASAFARTYRHPLTSDEPPPTQPGAAAPAPTCGACHNAHVAAHGDGPATARESSPALLGVARVRVSNGPAGSPPVLEPVPAREVALAREHEVCFKCHSSASRTPARGADVAAAFNTANASYHPVEDTIRSGSLDGRSFVPAWRGERRVTCSDCHSSDDGLGRGPHGSSYPRILKKRHVPAGSPEPVLDTDLCFDCHAYQTYADPLGGAGGAFSRFPGHLSHASRGVACAGCHAAHGSPTLPALLVLRSPGLMAYSRDAGGGSCNVSCHRTAPAAATYQAAFAR